MENRKRNNQLKIRLSHQELALIQQKYKLSRSKTMRHFIVKSVLEKQIYEIDMQPFREIQHLLSKTSNNINQIAKKVNTYSIIYKKDITAIQNDIQILSKEVQKLQTLLYRRANGGQ